MVKKGKRKAWPESVLHQIKTKTSAAPKKFDFYTHHMKLIQLYNIVSGYDSYLFSV